LQAWAVDRQLLVPVLRPVVLEHDSDVFVWKRVAPDLALWVAKRSAVGNSQAYFFEYVTIEMLSSWQTDFETVYAFAFENFKQLDHGGQRINDDSGDLVILDRSGVCSASVVGSSECLGWFSDLGESLVVAIPSRDRLFICGRQSRLAAKISAAAVQFYANDEHPVSNQVYLWNRISLTIWNERGIQ